MMMTGRSRSPFTVTQWQELEHQALVFSYMTSGMPIPPDLIRRSIDLIPSRLFPNQPMTWGCFQMGCGRKVDPEPGRCRRTDGKKWRCSKEAYPDSKYCERHMHRGKNRSRKPVEITPASPSMTSTVSSHPLFPSSSYHQQQHHHFHDPSPSPLHYRHPFSPQNHTAHFSLDTGSHYSGADKHSLSLNAMKEEVDEHPFFSEASGTLRGYGESLTSMSSVAPASNYARGLKLNDFNDMSKQSQHCFVLGTDFKLATPNKMEGQEETRRLFDDWPRSRDDPWSDLERDRPESVSSFSTTQLSISTSSSNFLSSKSRVFDDE